MAKLHLVSQTIEINELKKDFIRYVREGDQVLFISDSVNNLLIKPIADFIGGLDNQCFALNADAKCRGIEHLLPKTISQISDKEMVELSINNEQIISW